MQCTPNPPTTLKSLRLQVQVALLPFILMYFQMAFLSLSNILCSVYTDISTEAVLVLIVIVLCEHILYYYDPCGDDIHSIQKTESTRLNFEPPTSQVEG
jgi:hypothetical protein